MKVNIGHRYPLIIRKLLGDLPYIGWRINNIKSTVKLKKNDPAVWSADWSLSKIAVPMLEQLRDTKHGYPSGIDQDDVPANLHTKAYEEWEGGEDPIVTDAINDDICMKQWTWILDEMIWAHAEIANDGDGETKFYNFPSDIGEDLLYNIKNCEVDEEGLQAYRERLQNGLRLFGKYYQALWW